MLIRFLFVFGLLFPYQNVSAISLGLVSKSVVTIKTDVGEGSGVVIRNDGVIVTNHHVLEGASDAVVYLSNGDEYEDAQFIYSDPKKDILILKIGGFDLDVAILGNSNQLVIGESIFAIGSPQGYEGTVSKGIVTSIRSMDKGHKLIQMDAAISPGSSGGGVFNKDGELIGVSVGYIKNAQNINFAIPINYVRGVSLSTKSIPIGQYLLTQLNSFPSDSNTELSEVSQSSVEKLVKFIEDDFGVLAEIDDDGDYSIDHPKLGKFYIFIKDGNSFSIIKWLKFEEKFSRGQLERLLEINLEYDLVKNGVTDQYLVSLAEAPLSTLTQDIYDSMMENLLTLMRDSVKVLDPTPTSSTGTDTQTNVPRPNAGKYTPTDNVRRIDLLDRRFSIYPDRSWVLGPPSIPDSEIHIIEMSKGKKVLKVIAENLPLEFSVETIKTLLIYNIEEVDAVYEFMDEGVRTIGGNKVYWASVNVTVKGIKVNYDYTVYSGDEGLVQIIIYTYGHGISKETLKDVMELSQTFTVN